MRKSIENLHLPYLDKWYTMSKEDFRTVIDRDDAQQLLSAEWISEAAAFAKKKGWI